MRKVAVTAANVPDARGATGLLDRHPGRVWADAAYNQGAFVGRIRRRRGEARIVRRRHRGERQAMAAAKRAWNAAIHPVRCRIEKVFGTAKRSYGLARARYLGRRRVSLQVHFTFLAYNLRRAATLLRSAAA